MELINVKKKRNREPIDRKGTKLQIRVTKAERSAIKKRALLLNMTMSDYVRSLLWNEREGTEHEI